MTLRVIHYQSFPAIGSSNVCCTSNNDQNLAALQLVETGQLQTSVRRLDGGDDANDPQHISSTKPTLFRAFCTQRDQCEMSAGQAWSSTRVHSDEMTLSRRPSMPSRRAAGARS